MKNVLLIAAWLLLVLLSAKTVPAWRVTNQYADLLPASAQQVLHQHPPISIDVFAQPESAAAVLVDNFLQPLLDSLPAASVNHIDASLSPELVKQYGIQKQGEMVVHSGEQYFQLSSLSYEAFFNGLKRMSQPSDRWIVFLDGLQGKTFDAGQANSYSDWLGALKAANYRSVVLNWQPQLQLPKMARLVVLPSPASSLTDAQMAWLEAQIEQGLSLFWLADPQTAVQQPALSLLFDVMRTDAYHAGRLVIKQYNEHAINKDFDRPLDLYDVMPFVTANQPLWLNDKQQVLAASQEISGANGLSRLLVIGDSDFLNNSYLRSGGNLEMSFRVLDWLLQHDNRIDLPSIGLHQSQLHFSQQHILLFAGVMLIIVPLLMLLLGAYFWYKSRRAR